MLYFCVMIDLEKYGFIGSDKEDWKLPNTGIRVIKHGNIFCFLHKNEDGYFITLIRDIEITTHEDFRWIVRHCPSLEDIAINVPSLQFYE